MCGTTGILDTSGERLDISGSGSADYDTPLRTLLVASDVGDHKALFRDGETGVLFEAESIETLVAAALGLVVKRERWPALRGGGRRFFESERMWRDSAAHYRRPFEMPTERAMAA